MTQPGKEIKTFTIPAVGTHNTVYPFAIAMDPGVGVELKAIVITGAEPGPSMYVGGGQHGDEIGGMKAAWEIAERTDYRKLKGKLTVVPLQNPAGFRFRSRLNPYDPVDPDQIHPGDPNGRYYEREKYILGKLASECDCVIDLHTAGYSGANSGYVYVPPETGNGAGKRSLELAVAFGGDAIIQTDDEENYGWPVKSTLPFVAVREGRLGIYPEAGQGGALMPEDKYVQYHVTGVSNVMAKLGMIEGQTVKQGKGLLVDPASETHVRAPSEGLLRTLVEPGDSVKKGETIAVISLIPTGSQEVKSESDGVVVFLERFGSVAKNEVIATLYPE